MTKLIKRFISTAELKRIEGCEHFYFLPLDSSSSFKELFLVLEQKSRVLGIKYFGITMTTLEEIFLKLSNSIADEFNQSMSGNVISDF